MTEYDLNARYKCFEKILSDLFERIVIPVDTRRNNFLNKCKFIIYQYNSKQH
jgi:hypothetical protein